MRRGTFAVVVSLIGLAGCGSPHHSPANGDAVAQVRATWSSFFDTSTPVARREQLLDGGQRFTSVLAAEARGGAMSMTISSVHLSGTSHATVSFSLSIAPSTRLPSVGGAAVLVGGRWLVSSSTMCAVLTTTGQRSSACS